jgi:hypothetical protein
MENIYQYETNEDILIAKYIFHTEPVSIFFCNKKNDYLIYLDNR